MLRLTLFASLFSPLVSVAQPVAETSTPVPVTLDGQVLVLHATSSPDPARPLVFQPAEVVALSVVVPAATVGLGLLLGGGLDGLGAALVIGGLAVGPSAGNLVEGAYRDALVGGGVRVIGGGLVGAAAASSFLSWGHPPDTQVAAEGAALVSGIILVLVGTGYDIVTAGQNARSPHRLAVGADERTGAPVGVLRVAL